MGKVNYTLTIFFINNWIEKNGLSKATRTLFDRSGFEIIFNKKNDNLNAFKELQNQDDDYLDWFIGLDFIPWKNFKLGLTNIDWDPESENHRIEWSINVLKRLLTENNLYKAANLKFQYPEVFFKYYSQTNEITEILKKNYKTCFNQIDIQFKAFNSKFNIVKAFTDFGCNNKTELIEINNQKLICKTFKPDKLKYLENEVLAREKFSSFLLVSPIIKIGNNYILLKYIENLQPLISICNKYGLLKLNYVKKVFLGFKIIHEAGFIHLDFHPGNILIDSKWNLVFNDFEYLQSHNFEFNLLRSPGLIEHNKLFYNSPLEHITYKTHWYKLIRIPLWQLLYFPLGILYIIRWNTITTIIIKNFLKKCFRKK